MTTVTIKNIARKIGYAALYAVALACIALVVMPGVTGVRTVAILSGSMEPTISAGDAIVVKPYKNPETEIKVGDIATFQPVSADSYLITHRVIGKTVGQAGGPEFITQGDANGAADEPIKAGQVMGKTIMVIPFLGHIIAMSMTARLILAAIILALFYVPSALVRWTKRNHSARELEHAA